MIGGSIPDFKEKSFCYSFGMSMRNETTVGNVLNEIITDKKRA